MKMPPIKLRPIIGQNFKIKGLAHKIGWGMSIIGFLTITVLFILTRAYVDYPMTHKVYWYESESATPTSACVITIRPVSDETALKVMRSIHLIRPNSSITAKGYNTLAQMNDAQFFCNGTDARRVALVAYQSNARKHLAFISLINIIYTLILIVFTWFFSKKILFPWLRKALGKLKNKAKETKKART